ncbi:MAG: hypothetical protein COA78_29790 [Blastopirellula sp.]|nr:MAG: hypothetical protein COA78_29790 [Blastopirellula sp.]
MKPVIIIAVSLIVGVTIGYCSSIANTHSLNDFGPVTNPNITRSVENNKPAPKAVVIGGEEHDFGSMELGAVGKYTFVIKNEGDAPLKLEEQGTTCKCTISSLANNEILPGESANIDLEWTPKSYAADFSQTATIGTNDPRRAVIDLIIRGSVTESLHLEPPQINLSNISANESNTTEAVLFSHKITDLEINKVEFIGDHSDYYSAEVKPLSQEELAEHKGALSGQKILITLKKGLPIGSNRIQIKLHTNDEKTEVELPVTSQIVGDITIASVSKYKVIPNSNVLLLGNLKSNQGAKARLNVIAKGPYRNEITIKIHEVTPKFLKVSFGEVNELSNGKVRMFPLKIEVPVGSPAANHLGKQQGGFGEIVLRSEGHPNIEELVIRIKFSVE